MNPRVQLALFALALCCAAAVHAPQRASAQPGQETVTAQINITLPTGEQVTGAIVNRRQLGSAVRSTWTFSGMASGQPVQAAGTATERWLGGGQLEIAMETITSYQVGSKPSATNPDGTPYVPSPLLQTVLIADVGNGVLTVRGIPLAISAGSLGAKLYPPGSGDISYVVTSAGQGPAVITSIPNTADRTLASARPLFPALVGLLLAATAVAAIRRRARA